MRHARILKTDGTFLVDLSSGRPLKLDARELESGQQAKDILKKLQNQYGLTNLTYCCSYGNCQSTVHFRKEIEKVAGKRSRGRPQTWVSDDITKHDPGCPGPSEQDFDHLPHNGLNLNDAIAKQGEYILFHLNVELDSRIKKKFNKASKLNTEDVIWRKKNSNRHSYFAVSTLQELTSSMARIVQQSGKNALERTMIVYEGKIVCLKDFIVRNTASDRMRIIEGEDGMSGLRYKARLQENHNIKNSYGGNWTFGKPRLFMFEAAQNIEKGRHPDRDKKAVRGWRYDTEDGRIVYDQIHFQKLNIDPDSLFPNGALVLAIPFIHPQQDRRYPMVHWSIRSLEQIDCEPPKEAVKVLCWDGQNIPNPPKPPRQGRLNLRPTR